MSDTVLEKFPYWQLDPSVGPDNEGTVLYSCNYQERRLDIGLIPMSPEYIPSDNYTNVEYLDAVINLLKICYR